MGQKNQSKKIKANSTEESQKINIIKQNLSKPTETEVLEMYTALLQT